MYGQDKCSAKYAHGTSVTLTATACPGSSFVAWGGDCAFAKKNKTCTLTITKDTNVSAKFILKPKNLRIGEIDDLLIDPKTLLACQNSNKLGLIE